jgi:hypothetical protein
MMIMAGVVTSLLGDKRWAMGSRHRPGTQANEELLLWLLPRTQV